MINKRNSLEAKTNIHDNSNSNRDGHLPPRTITERFLFPTRSTLTPVKRHR